MRNHQIIGLETDLSLYPLDPAQGATKKYVDAQREAVQALIPGTLDNGSY